MTSSTVRKERRRQERRRPISKFCCPICGGVTTSHVIEGRMDAKAGYYWRRRVCDSCGEQFTTKELLDALNRPQYLPQHLEDQP